MTFREAYGTVQGLLAHYAPEVKDTTVYRLIKAATMRFAAETGVNVQIYDITADGSRDYTLPQVRLGRIWRAEYVFNNIAFPLRGIPLSELDVLDQSTNTTGSPISVYCRFARTFRVWPLASSGTIRIYHAPTPVLANRDSATSAGETATSGTTVTAVVSSLSQGIVANRAGASDYFNDCRIVFTSGTTLTNQFSYITGINEGASSVTITFSPAVSIAVTTETFRIEDVLEVPDEYAMGCVYYAAGVLAGIDNKAKQLASTLLGDWDRIFQKARGEGFALGPDIQTRMIPQNELAYSRWRQEMWGGWR